MPCCIPSTPPKDGDINLFSRRNPRDNLTKLPPLPFLVPAVLETLLASDEFKDITEVVPGEADIYCASEVNKRGGVVLTGDSDLLVYDLGQKGSVVFLRDIEDQFDGLHSQIYHPNDIADRLGLRKSLGLHALAFEMKLDIHASLTQLLVRAKALETVLIPADEFVEFRKEYALLPRPPLNRNKEPETLAVLKTLDPRISEFVLQYPSISAVTGQSPENDHVDAARHIFIPFLLDCPARTNAWETSMAVRQLAYGLMNLVVPDDERRLSAFEHKRREGNSEGRELTLPDATQIPGACLRLVYLLTSQIPTALPQEDIWLAAAIYQDVEWSHYNSKTCLSQSFCHQATSLAPGSDLHWDILHLYAQIQGSYYSFRILKQILNLVLSQKSNYNLPKQVFELHNVLQTLPPLSSIQEATRVSSILRIIKENGMVNVAQKLLGISLPELPDWADKKAGKKKRKRNHEPVSTLGKQAKPSNPFALLEME